MTGTTARTPATFARPPSRAARCTTSNPRRPAPRHAAARRGHPGARVPLPRRATSVARRRRPRHDEVVSPVTTHGHQDARPPAGYPRLELSLSAVRANTGALTERLLGAGIELTGVTKAVDGEPLVGEAMLEAGAAGLADSRLPRSTRLAAPRPGPADPHPAAAAGRARDGGAGRRPRPALGPGDRRARSASAPPARRSTSCSPSTSATAARASSPTTRPSSPPSSSRLRGVVLAGIAVNFACLSGQLPTRRSSSARPRTSSLSVAGLCAAEPLLSLGGTCCLQHLDGFAPRVRTEVRSGGGPLYGYDFVTMAPLAGLRAHRPAADRRRPRVLRASRRPRRAAPAVTAFGHVPDADLPDDDAWYALHQPRTPRLRARGLRPLTPARGSPASPATSPS